MHSRHRRHARLIAAAAAALSLTALLSFTCIPTALIALPLGAMPARRLLVPPRRLHLSLRAVREPTPTDHQADAVLLPDWEVLVLLHHNATVPAAADNATCSFRGGASSPARALGRLPGSGRHPYTCAMPNGERRHQPFHAPRLVFSSSAVIAAGDGSGRSPEMLRWSGRLAYDSVVADDGDVLVFAKGVNPRQGSNRAAADVRCLYYRGAAADVVASLPAATSAQQVFRCPPPPEPAPQELRLTLAVAGEEPIPSLATYNPPLHGSSATAQVTARSTPPGKKLICACTMVRDVAKFLREWVVYHAAVGIDRFYIYDNGSEDDLAGQVRQLSWAGFDISTQAWPWPKTQEAGFSHSAAVHRDSCEWMAFIDVDEFIFSSRWAQSENPTESMLRSVVSAEAEDVGQVLLGCADFGPSGRTTHPEEGVTQGYTCRRRTEERHKSLVRLDAVDRSLVNSVHHFALRPGFRGGRNRRVGVNHYKYQAWDEFKVKFRRRVSTYVADWTDRVNLESRDRAPGLGFEAVEPVGWAQKFCEVDDTRLRDVTRRWFGVGFGNMLPRRQIGATRR